MNNYIYVKKKAVSREKCENIINTINSTKLKPANSKNTKDFYNGTYANVYEQEWSEDLFNCMLEYKKQNTLLDSKNLCQWKIQIFCNYQKYNPNQHYKEEHCEHGGTEAEARRMLVWMFYCNTIKEGGGTYFPQQDITLNPEQGTIAIWPASWTHSHYGLVAPKEYKYIVTGWANYIKI